MENTFSFNTNQLTKLFPFYILIDTGMRIISCGKSLEKIYAGCNNKIFNEQFIVKRPFTEAPDIAALNGLVNQLIVLEARDNETILRGQFELLEESNNILFIGSPWFGSIEQVKENHLTLHDFAFHDPLIDLLHVLKTQEIGNNELKELLSTINQQKKELIAATKSMEDFALISMQDTNPILRLNMAGEIILMNPAAEKLTNFFYNDALYTRIELWKKIVHENIAQNTINTFEATCEMCSYSFSIKYLEDQQYFNVYGTDITLQKQNEERLRVLSQIAEDNINAVIITDEEGCIGWVNKSFTSMTGYSAEEAKGKKPGHFLQGEETDPLTVEYLKIQIMSGKPFNTEIINYAKNGRKYWVRIQGQTIKNPKGELQGFFAIEEDITQEKEIQKKLKESEQKLRFAMEIFGDNVWEHDFSSGITSFSKSDHTLLGISNTNIEKNAEAWWNAVHENDKAMLIKNDSLYKQGVLDHHSLEYRIVHKNGAVKWVLDRGVVIEKHVNGKPLKIIGTHTEITSIKEIEEELRKSQQLWNFALKSSGVCVWGYDFENNRGSYSSEYAQMLGYQQDEVQKDYDWMLHVHQDDKELLRQNDLRYLYNLQSQHSLTYRLRCKDGSYKWILDRGMLIERSEDDRPLNSIGTHTDITHIKQTETELSNRFKQFQSLSENIPGVLYEYEFCADGTEGIKYISPAIERLFGIKTEDFVNYLSYIHPDDRERINKKNKHCKETLEPFYDESRITIPGKEIKWHSVHSSFSYETEKGNKVYTGFMLDITERKNAEERLEKQRKFYEDILNNMPADIAVFNTNHEYLFVNPQGIGDADVRKWIIGKKDEDYVAYRNKPKEIVASRRALFNNVVSKKTSGEWEEKLLLKDGKEKWVLRRFSPVLDSNNNVTLVLGYGIDITQRRTAEEAIRRSEEKYRMLITNMNLGLVEVDKDGTILFANQTFCNMSGYDSYEVTGKETFDLLLGESAKIIRNEINEKRKNGISEAYELAVNNKDGEKKWWLISGAPLIDESGIFTGSIGIHLDITKQKNLEQQLRFAKKDAEESSIAKEIFLANMSHEIRTPMNAIMGMSRQLKKTLLDERQRGYLNAITNASENLLVIINDILDFSKIESGKLSLEKIGFSIKNVIANCSEVIDYKLKEKGLHYESSISSYVAPVFIGDPYRLNQILLNLLSNAIKFTEKGSINISCIVDEQLESQQQIKITVTDTGVGMTDEFLETLFNKFSQEDESISRRYGGTGLGMSICKQLVEMMDGTIQVASEKGAGTSVCVSIPLLVGTVADLPVKDEIISDKSLLKGSRILLAEDNEMNRIVANTILEQYGAVVDNAANGREAVDMLRKATYDLVLMDVRMPEMDGFEATNIIREQVSESIAIIALTANALKLEQEKCMQAGMNDFLAKPFEEDALVSIIAKWLGKEIILKGSKLKSAEEKQQHHIYNLDKLKSISRGNESFVKKMIQIFITECINSSEQLKQAFESHDFNKIKSIAHKMKPSVKNMGIGLLTDDILFMENMPDGETSSEKLTLSLEKTINVLNTVVGQLQNEISDTD